MAEKETSKRDVFVGCIPAEAREHMRAARREMRKSVEALLPPGLVEHRRAARKEALLAVRSMVDAALKRIEEHEKA